MMYRLFHKLFGWDYIYWTNLTDQGIARIYVDAENKPYYYRYRIPLVIDPADGSRSMIRWLTCHRTKYIN